MSLHVHFTFWLLKGLFTKIVFQFCSRGTASRGPMWRRESKPLGTKLKPKFFEFGAFIDPIDQNQLCHTPWLFKIWDLNDRLFWWTIPLNPNFNVDSISVLSNSSQLMSEFQLYFPRNQIKSFRYSLLHLGIHSSAYSTTVFTTFISI